MSEVDSDGNGFIDYTEFLKASVNSTTLLSRENLAIAFSIFDKDNSGKISAKELKAILQGNMESDDSVWLEVVNNIDANGDGEIDFEEFQDIVFKEDML